MKRVLITGMSGTGKSTVTAALAALGYRAVDADEDGYAEVVRVPEDELTGLDPGPEGIGVAALVAAPVDTGLPLGICVVR